MCLMCAQFMTENVVHVNLFDNVFVYNMLMVYMYSNSHSLLTSPPLQIIVFLVLIVCNFLPVLFNIILFLFSVAASAVIRYPGDPSDILRRLLSQPLNCILPHSRMYILNVTRYYIQSRS